MTIEYFPEQSKLFYFWKGRVALYTILKALNVGHGDEVIVPGFTCVVVPNAILYLGATPVYADIEPETCNLSARTIEPLITPRTRVILAQNTFGLSADLDPIMALAERHGITVVEDCAHGLGGYYKGRRNGTVAHASFFSTQWSKPVSTGLGGIAYVQDHELAENVEKIIATLPKPEIQKQVFLLFQWLVRPLADYPVLHYPLVKLYRFLTQRIGVSVGSSTGNELTTTRMPPGYLRRMGTLQYHQWQRLLDTLEHRITQRQTVANRYDAFFTGIGMQTPFRPKHSTHGMLRYAIRVPNKKAMLMKAQEARIPLGDWFVSPLHPVIGDLTSWNYHSGQCPEAERACREVINLFTDHPLSQRQLQQFFHE